MVKEATKRGEGATVCLAQATLAALHNGLGNYDDALAAATPPDAGACTAGKAADWGL